ncbi:MAG: kelch repeat-containing protein [Flavobacteriales bacterium]
MCSLSSKWMLVVLCMAMVSLTVAQANTWVKMSDFSGGKRERAVAFALGTYGYVGTGTDTGEMVRNDFWRYDPIGDTWTQVAELPGSARRDAVAFSIDDRGYVGTGMSEHVSANGTLLNDFWCYNPVLNQWDSIASYPGNQMNGVYFATGFSVNEKGYVCGGKTGNSTYSAELWEYKPSTNTWIQRAPFPTGIRYMLSSFSIGNVAYVGFGATQDVYKRDLFQYNPGNNTWTPMPDLPGNVRGGACTFVLQDKGYVCGGYDGGLLDDLWEFDPVEQMWNIRAYFGGSERKNAVSFSVNNAFAVVGLGKGYSGKKESIYRYYPTLFLAHENLQTAPFSLFPNPSSGSIQLQGPIELIEEITCFDALGKRLFSWKNDESPFTFPRLPSGGYLLKVKRSDQLEEQPCKFIITE